MSPDDTDLDDLQWFELMAGRNASDARSATRADAAWLRAALLSYAPQPPSGVMPEAGARATRLIARAVAAGVLRPAELTGWRRALHALRQPKPGRQRGWQGLGLATLAVLSLTLFLRVNVPMPPGEPADAERGAAVQQVISSDAPARQKQLLRALRAAGLDAQPYERLGRLGVDVELPQPLSPPQRAALQNQGLKPPAGRSLLIEIVPP